MSIGAAGGFGRSIKFTMSANSVINCAIAVSEMSVNCATQKCRVCVTNSRSRSKNLIAAIIGGECRPIQCPLVQMVATTNQYLRRSKLVAKADKVCGHPPIVVIGPKTSREANGGNAALTQGRICPSLSRTSTHQDKCSHDRNNGCNG